MPYATEEIAQDLVVPIAGYLDHNVSTYPAADKSNPPNNTITTMCGNYLVLDFKILFKPNVMGAVVMEKIKSLPVQVILLVDNLKSDVKAIAAAKTDVDREKALEEALSQLSFIIVIAGEAAAEVGNLVDQSTS